MNVVQRSFSSGEIAPTLYGRTDLSKYATGIRTCRNFIVQRAGGVTNRPGTELVGEVTGGSLVRLLPFVFNDSQTYILEFSNQQIRFIRDGAYVGGPYAISTPYLSSELADLQIAQSADVVTIVHPNHAPANLKRLGDTNWTLTTITFEPGIAAPANVRLVPSTDSSVGSGGIQWIVTAIDKITGKESLASVSIGIDLAGINTLRSVNWDAVTGASEYNVYKGTFPAGSSAPDFGFIGATGTTAFYDSGITPDMQRRAPVARNPFSGAGNYPAAVSYFQDRRVYAGATNGPTTVYTSRSADYDNFSVTDPVQDDDAITFTLTARKVSTVRHILDAGALVLFTSGGEWLVNGDNAGILRPTDIGAVEVSSHGAARQPPIKIDRRLLYVQARGSVIRDVAKDPWYGYKGTDLTVFSSHLFEGHTVADWTYAEIPNSVVWVARDDGVLLGLTDLDEQQVLAWHRHDTDGVVENVCALPEGNEDRLYMVVRRTVDGSDRRYVERMASRYFSDVQDAIFTDSTLTYDGRNTDPSILLIIGGGTTWEYDELLALSSTSTIFSPSDVGNEYVVTGDDGTVMRLRVTVFNSTAMVGVFANKTVPVSMRAHGVSTWAKAVDTVSGLDHLEGKTVSVFADGYVVASPNNSELNTVTVTGGSVTLDRPYAYIHVGLPFTSDLETLDIDSGEGPSLKEKRININKLVALLDNSRGVFAGSTAPADDSITGLVELKIRQTENYDQPVMLRTGPVIINMQATWSLQGRVFIRQVDPLPLTVLSVVPSGFIPSPSP